MTMFFGGMGKIICDSCGAWAQATWEADPCGDMVCRWCADEHDENCAYHTDVCPDHQCERCIDRAVDNAMYRMESERETDIT
jgi:hypothetical protein